MFESDLPSTRQRDQCREELEERIASLQADINAANARLAVLVEEHARNEDWLLHEGIRSESQFLSWRVGLPPAAANTVVQVAEGLRSFPRIAAAFRAGRLSLEAVRSLIQVADAQPEDEPELLRLALGMSGSQLARFCAYYRRILRIENGRHRARFLRTSYTSDGMWRISGLLPAEDGAVVDVALAAVVKALREKEEKEQPAAAVDSSETSDSDALEAAEDPFAAERGDGLVALAESFLQGGSYGNQARDRHLVVVHADAVTLATGEGEARIEGGGAIPPEAAARIACEAPVVTLLEKAGKPLSVGRKTRRVGRGLRSALEARDRQCGFPGCHRGGQLQAHHIKHWQDGGETSPENLLLLCRSHHIAVHESRLSIERTLSGFLFRRPDGSLIIQPSIRAGGPGIGHANRALRIDVTPETCAPEWGGERGSIGYVVDVFASRSSPSGPAP